MSTIFKNKPPSIVAVIPVRMAATRFPGKPLARIGSLPMIEHVRRRTLLCSSLKETIVATCDTEIMDEVRKYGGKAIMTSDRHERCTDRIAEVAESLEAEIVVNIQGDEPLLQPRMIEELLSPLLEDPSLRCSNLILPIQDRDEFCNPNVVKVVMDSKGNLLYASREPIPSRLKAASDDYPKWKQLGIIAFRKDFLLEFSRLTPTFLEKVESVDMMRAVEHGHRVRMVATSGTMIGVDVPEDVRKVELILHNDPLTKEYL